MSGDNALCFLPICVEDCCCFDCTTAPLKWLFSPWRFASVSLTHFWAGGRVVCLWGTVLRLFPSSSPSHGWHCQVYPCLGCLPRMDTASMAGVAGAWLAMSEMVQREFSHVSASQILSDRQGFVLVPSPLVASPLGGWLAGV